MKKNIFAIALVAIALCMASCQKENPLNGDNGSELVVPKVTVTADLAGTNWTAALSMEDLLTAMGMNISDFGCSDPAELGAPMMFYLSFDNQYAHITFGDDIVVLNAGEVNGEYTLEEIQQMDLAYVYDGATHTGHLTAVGTDENGDPIDYQINFTYSDNDDTITINFQFTDENDAVINFPMVFQRNAVNA